MLYQIVISIFNFFSQLSGIVHGFTSIYVINVYHH